MLAELMEHAGTDEDAGRLRRCGRNSSQALMGALAEQIPLHGVEAAMKMLLQTELMLEVVVDVGGTA